MSFTYNMCIAIGSFSEINRLNVLGTILLFIERQ